MADVRTEIGVLVRLWAAAKHAAGVAEVEVQGGLSIATIQSTLGEQYGEELARILGRCSVLVDGVQAPREAVVAAGSVVEFLPPFAGG